MSTLTGNPLLRSTDDGLTWQATGLERSLVAFSPGFAADRTVFALQQYTEEDGIQRSTDGGVSWERIGAGSLPAGQYQDWDGLAISPNFSADHTLVAWTYRSAPHGVYLSTDAGQTWVGIAPRVYEQRFAAFSPNYAQDHRLWRSEAGSSAHFLVTTDNGQSWQAAGDMPGATVYGLTSAGPGNDSPLWALTPYGLLATSPTGDVPTWLLDYTSFYASQRPGARSALAVSPSFAQDGTAVAHDSITTDGGQSWQALSFAEELRQVRTSASAFAPDFARSHVIAIGWSSSGGNQGGPFALSADGGQTWQRWWHPVAAPVAVVFDAAWPTNPAVYLAGERGLVHSSLQDWQRAGWSVDWQRAGEPVGWLNVTGLVSRDEGNQSVLYAATSTHGVYRSADGGQTWAAFNAGLPSGHTCRLANAADLLAVSLCDGSLYLWQSALASWQRVGDPAPGGINALLLQRGRANGTAWVGTASGLYRTTFSAPVLTPRLWFPLLLRQ